MKKIDYVHGLGIIRTVDHGKKPIDWHAMAIWLLLMVLFIWGGVREWIDYKRSLEVEYIKLFQGPTMPTEWTISRGKVFISQCPYTILVSINGWQIAP